MNLRTNQKPCWITFFAMDPHDTGWIHVIHRPKWWWGNKMKAMVFQLPVIFLLMITLPLVICYHYSLKSPEMTMMMMIKIAMYFKGNICLSLFKFLFQKIKRQVSLYIFYFKEKKTKKKRNKKRQAETTTKTALNKSVDFIV